MRPTAQFLITIFLSIAFSVTGNAQWTYEPLFENNTFVRSIDQSKPVGVINGSAGTSPTGAATYTIPIKCPPGTNGFTPSLSVGYSSQSGNGLMGMGWSLAGIGVITRIPKDHFHDNTAGAVEFSSNDVFALDGLRLVADAGTYGNSGTTYRLESDNFSQVTSYDAEGSGPRWFRIRTKDGITMDYGGTTDSRVIRDNGSEVMVWRLNKIEDISGNYILFEYNNIPNAHKNLLSKIRYTGNGSQLPYNEIVFGYRTRTDNNRVYEGGSAIHQEELLEYIQIKDESNQVVKAYWFKYGYNTSASYLNEIIEKDKHGTALNSTIFKYGDDPNQFSTEGNNIVNLNSQCKLFSGDFDGDGVAEIVSSNTATGPGNYTYTAGITIYKKDPSTNTYNIAQNLPYGNSTAIRYKKNDYPANSFGLRKTDFDGDGKEDILTITSTLNAAMNYYDFNSFNIYKGDGSAVLNTTPQTLLGTTMWNGQNINVTQIKPQHHESFFTGDFNGDKKSDIIAIFEGGSNNSHFPFMFESGAGVTSILNINFSLLNTHDFKAEVLDFDGDGKSELMLLGSSAFYIYSFNEKANHDYDATLVHSGGFPTNWHHTYPGDFNGDGKTDFLVCDGDGVAWLKAISTGKTFVVTGFVFDHPLPPAGFITSYDRVLLADYNGDGMTDILQVYNDPANTANDKVVVYYSTGLDFSRRDHTGSSLQGPLSPADLNGDGRADVISKQCSGSCAPTFMYFKKLGKENLLEKVADGFGRTTTFSYSLLSNGSVYNPGGTNNYPLGTLVQGTILSSITVPNGIGGQSTTSYTYEEGVVHKVARGFMGFKKITSLNTTTDIKTETKFAINTTYYTPYKTEENTYLASTNEQLSHATFNVGFQSTTGHSFFKKMNSSSEQDMLTGATSTTTNTYDNYGNITLGIVNINNVEIIETTTTYVAAQTVFPARVSLVSVKKTRTGSPSLTDQVAFTYDPKGRIDVKTENANRLYKKYTKYRYNAFGNIDRETVTGDNIVPVTGAITTYTYDGKGRFPTSTLNALGQQSTTTWDFVWGKPITFTGVDGVAKTNSYDSWGKLISTNYSTYTVTFSEDWDVTNGAIWYEEMIHPGLPDEKKWYDLMGREIRKETEHFNSQKLYSSQTYNSKGQLISVVKPHLLSETPITTNCTFNSYGLPWTTSNVQGTTTTTYVYSSGLTTTNTSSPKGQLVIVKDAAGRMLEQTDNGGKLNYTYDSRGNVLSVKQGVLTLVTTVYDAYGRKETVVDCDHGTTLYGYDAWSRLTSEKDAKNHIHTYTYNVMGMRTQRVGPEGTTTYQYHSIAGTGSVNQLKTVIGFNGATDEFNYNSKGLLNYKKRTFDSKVFYVSYTHNNYGDVTNVTYHTGFTYQNIYDQNGFLQKVTSNWTGQTVDLFTGHSINSDGEYTSYTSGNGITTTKMFANGFPTNIDVPGILQLDLGFDHQTGNLSYRQDNLKNFVEEFTYDNLNRLTSSTAYFMGSGGWGPNMNPYYLPTYTTSYDQSATNSLGNIVDKTDVGHYSYGSFPRHAVKSVTNTLNNISVLQQDITYTSFKRAEKVTENNIEQTFTYDASYRRAKSQLANGNTVTTRYYWDDFELNNSTTNIYYVRGGDGLCAIVEHTPTTSFKAIHYVYKDHLGSILAVTDQSGALEVEQNFDAWGRSRDPIYWTYGTLPANPTWLSRGFTGHEHMPEFSLINMNARLYDPILGRMLGPDIFTQDGTQGQNRYSYALNNPLSYIDPDGNNPLAVAIVVGAAVSMATYTYSVAVSPGGFDNWDWSQFAFSGFSGAMSGMVTFGIGSAFGAVGNSLSVGTIANELGRAAAHGYSGFIFGSMGGNGEAGFWASAASSLAGSIGANIPILNTDGGSTLFSMAVGGTAAEISGGEFIIGAAQGLTVHVLNHLMHPQEEGRRNPAQDKKLSPGEIKRLKEWGWDHSEKGVGGGKTDLFRDPETGEIYQKPKSGVGEGEPIGVNWNDVLENTTSTIIGIGVGIIIVDAILTYWPVLLIL